MLCGGGRIEGNFDADFLDLHFETGESSGGGFVDVAGVGFDFSDADIGASVRTRSNREGVRFACRAYVR